MYPFYREDLIRIQQEERERTQRHSHQLDGPPAPQQPETGLSRRLAGAIAELRGTPLSAPPCPEPSEAMS
jgi:hypothetical protein